MIKLLIADDEPFIRKGIRSTIPWHEHDIEVIGGDIRFTDFPLEGGYSSSVTGSYSFDVQDDDHEKAKMNIRIGT